MTTNTCSTLRLNVGLFASHSLVMQYLADLLLQLDMGATTVALHDFFSGSQLLPALVNGVIVFDLYDLPLPISYYVDDIRCVCKSAALLAIGQHRDARDVATLLLGGVSGFLSYEEVRRYLAPAIVSLARGDTWAQPDVMRQYMTMTSHRPSLSDAGTEALTKREGQVRDLLTRRYSNKEIAALLGICESTVKFHVSNVLAKLNAAGRRELGRERDREFVLPLARKCG